MIVLKYGGTSVSSVNSVKGIHTTLSHKKDNFLVVVSALSGITTELEILAETALNRKVDDLIAAIQDRHISYASELLSESSNSEVLPYIEEVCKELADICHGIYILNDLSPRTQARVLSTGELLSSRILHYYLTDQGLDIEWVDSRKVIKATGNHLAAEVDFTTSGELIKRTIDPNKNYIAGGFIASNTAGETVTLGRGGSDYSAAIYANALEVDSIEIWSDVDGIHQANPNVVKNTKAIQTMSYEEAFEMAYFGAKVLYPPAVIPLKEKNIPIYLKNTFDPAIEGTVISGSSIASPDKIKGLSSIKDIAMITVSGVGLVRQKGRARKVFQTLEENSINVILITQGCSEQSIGVGIKEDDIMVAEKALNDAFDQDIKKGMINEVSVLKDLCIIALVGDHMKNKVGLGGKIFGAIGENGINVSAIAQGSSERNISIVIDKKDEEKALNVIHEKFFGDVVKKVHLFIAGVGNVGNEFMKIIQAQKDQLFEEHRIQLIVSGICNSSRYLFDEDGISEESINLFPAVGETYERFSEFVNDAVALNLRNSIFIDNTASKVVSEHYTEFLKESISIAACNKIACSGHYEDYARLVDYTKEYNCDFKYETTVGAALPIIKTIQDLRLSGDHINKIEAVLSGSLNFIFNNYGTDNLFADVVWQAKKEGYTEPDPLIDLSGLDVMRKILILSREAGLKKELSDISFTSFLPEDCLEAPDNDALYDRLKDAEQHFSDILKHATDNGCKLKVVASLDNGVLEVKLRQIPSHSPFYNLEGKDNVVALYTDRYPTEPLVVKGAGAGAEVTASGVYADMMSIINKS